MPPQSSTPAQKPPLHLLFAVIVIAVVVNATTLEEDDHACIANVPAF
jgi:hypothetical protein